MNLPDEIEAYRSRVSIDDSAVRRTVIEQRGEMKLKPDGGWKPFTAEQWFAVDEVAFCWHARVKMAPLMTAVVEDAYEDGAGRLDARLWGAITVAHGEGPDIDRGEVQRYLAELAWNPVALFRNPKLNFDASGDGVTVWVGDRESYVDLGFDERSGDIIRASCSNRVRGEDGPTPWEGVFSEVREFEGIRIPTRGEVSWLLPEGRFTYWRGEVTALHLD